MLYFSQLLVVSFVSFGVFRVNLTMAMEFLLYPNILCYVLFLSIDSYFLFFFILKLNDFSTYLSGNCVDSDAPLCCPRLRAAVAWPISHGHSNPAAVRGLDEGEVPQ